MTILGGKAGWLPASRSLFETREALLEESLAPFADDLPGGVEARGDLVVVQTIGGIQGDLCTYDIAIR
jgi:hypothetical protein